MSLNYIIDYLKKNNREYIPIEDEKSIESIYNLYKDGKVSESLDEIVVLYHGIYFDINSENYDESFKYYELASKMGNSHAMNKLGHCYYLGCGIESNYLEAVKWYRRSAELGNNESMFDLGDCYYFGWGIEWNYEQAVVWYKKSAELGNSDAMYRLGICYYLGRGIELNLEQGVEWYTKSAELGNTKAMYRLGNYYYEEKTKDTIQDAILYYKKAYDLGNEKAGAKLRDITEDNLLIISYVDLVTRVKELEDLNSHLMVYPGSDYREALKDFNYMRANDTLSK